ncbi:MAG: hypothetical protein A3C43_12580 [Candidatus Schekmanbacteria bacterium RIFCSPHIGHO2_02_FULL_38_11]|uniref:Peptidase S8/S53 domain-containing protein n=1 Tax=Candidatus Schekmanbacteria bacterium RIFCSPLOWO2_12_FULL_38_15 TaxID=1817883 RepID=A0A1F7SI23_9BACT|nr:MAG: hypothetical protein A3H37_03140 [Candidatus Schekmanbacteria bacterium RIFCSPLOWO2_02_FULL_38_14]OGL53419.1 MAG: hypothetical protein A3G31_07925 [Candidatus Schekmanbacteria bacterium RIFCSPLOWO2_12_FULL_38_15]OGL55771.1 MAG: hypothetical protein A3C43_12580 [Candidatus Schekmanbacteria bacterium RIFCSPHIGHO2_02_FULL_38_11]
MKKFLLILLGACFLLSLSANEADSRISRFTISGIVKKTGTGKRLKDVSIGLSGTTSQGEVTRTSKTNRLGKYSFTKLLAGTYTIIPSFPGYVFDPNSQQITIAKRNKTANFKATPGEEITIEDIYKVALKKPAKISLKILNTSADLDLYLLDPLTGEKLAVSDSAFPGQEKSITVNDLGTYIIGVDAKDLESNYILTIDSFSTGSNFINRKVLSNSSKSATSSSIDFGVPVSGSLDLSDDYFDDSTLYDQYFFTGQANQSVDIRMSSAEIDSYLYLIYSGIFEDTIIAEDDDSGGGNDARISGELPYSGTYSIIANSRFVLETGSYTLTLEEFNPNATGSISGKLIVEDYISLTEEENNEDNLSGAFNILYFPVKIFGASEDGDPGTTITIPKTVSKKRKKATADFVPGEVVVKFKNGKTPSASKKVLQFNLKKKGESYNGPLLFEISELKEFKKSLSEKGSLAKKKAVDSLKAQTLRVIEKLNQDPDVLYAEPNYIYYPAKTPNDTYYKYQWHYPLINLPETWDITTGNSSVTVAVIDTGVLLNHPDLKTRLTSDGYDFISDAGNALDEDGIDSNADDPGDDPAKVHSSFHGSHVAGTIGALTDNSTGVAGVDWNCKIMPIRVLGKEGGTNFDITQAILYAARLENSSKNFPSKKADVINMSLGGPGSAQSQQDAITKAINAGVTIVAASGNSNKDSQSEPFYPASYDGVISVGAVDLNAEKAPYSNYGTRIDILAPGGDTSSDKNGDGYQDGVLSTLKSEESNEFNYVFYQGTSMASPHVAGIIALIQGARVSKELPLLSPSEIKNILINTSSGVSSSTKAKFPNAGLINPKNAVLSAIETSSGVGPKLAVSTKSLNFGTEETSLTVLVENGGGETLSLTQVTSSDSWLSASPESGDAPLILTVTVDRTGLSPGGYEGTIDIASNGGNAEINVSMQVQGEDEPTPGKRDIGEVFVLVVDKNTFETVAQAETNVTNNFSYNVISIPEGEYYIIAGTDRDNNDIICEDEDACGIFPLFSEPDLVKIEADKESSGIDFPVSELSFITGKNLPKKGFMKLKKKPKAMQ